MKKIVLATMLLVGCTQNDLARSFGGKAKYCTDPGQKVIGVTWKENSLWISTRTMRADEFPETVVFEESSGFGVMEGKVTIQERAVGSKEACK